MTTRCLLRGAFTVALLAVTGGCGAPAPAQQDQNISDSAPCLQQWCRRDLGIENIEALAIHGDEPRVDGNTIFVADIANRVWRWRAGEATDLGHPFPFVAANVAPQRRIGAIHALDDTHVAIVLRTRHPGGIVSWSLKVHDGEGWFQRIYDLGSGNKNFYPITAARDGVIWVSAIVADGVPALITLDADGIVEIPLAVPSLKRVVGIDVGGDVPLVRVEQAGPSGQRIYELRDHALVRQDIVIAGQSYVSLDAIVSLRCAADGVVLAQSDAVYRGASLAELEPVANVGASYHPELPPPPSRFGTSQYPLDVFSVAPTDHNGMRWFELRSNGQFMGSLDASGAWQVTRPSSSFGLSTAHPSGVTWFGGNPVVWLTDAALIGLPAHSGSDSAIYFRP